MTAPAGVHGDTSEAKSGSWKEYGLRFLFGGTITAVVGIVAKAFGPVVAGLFLAFPAILPASLTLIAKHKGDREARDDALGAAIGSVGLLVFGAVVWGLAPRTAAWITLACATIAWFVAAAGIWLVICTWLWPDGRSG
jgi:uncharacterized membrane protein (GlpM family)